MFESARLEHRLDKKAFKELEPQLREDLLDAQFDLMEAQHRTLLVLVNGLDGSGKGQVTNRLYEWLDPHFLVTMSYERPAEEEHGRPLVWKYWRDLPARGRIGIVLGSWYHATLLAHATGASNAGRFSEALDRIMRFEEMLAAEGVVVLKLWLQIDAARSMRRSEKEHKKGGLIRPVVEEWRAVDTAAERARLVEAVLEMVRVTSTGPSPWYVVPAMDARFRDAKVGAILLDTLRRENASSTVPPATKARQPVQANPIELPHPSILSSIDLSVRIADKEYEKRLLAAQERITRLTSAKSFSHTGLVCVFEGSDAAGKGGAIGRVRQALDPRRFRVHQISAPSEEEKLRPYLWRFWRRIPARGEVAFFDRSWYGRVLVERVEGFASDEDWRRAYSEINDFEEQLVEARYIVVKFWLAISQEEQLRRFEARERVPFKRFKLTPEDWRNRERWRLYEEAVTEMVDRTSTPHAPWTLVAAEQKRWARVTVCEAIADRLRSQLDRS